MAIGKKTGGRNFKKGNAGGPGRPRVPEDVKKIRALTNEELKRAGDMILKGTRQDLHRVMADPDAPAFKAWVASVTIKGIQKGDVYSLNELLNRMIGKVTEHVKHSGVAFTLNNIETGGALVMGAKEVEDDEEQD